MASKIRLFKIASEINIGKETIVEFLQNKGFDVHNKPTTVLTEEMADAVYDKFKKEKRAAEVQREKVLKQKETRKPAEKAQELKIEKKPLNERLNELLEAVQPKTKPVEEKETEEVETTQQEKKEIVEKVSDSNEVVEEVKKTNIGKNDFEYTKSVPGDTPKLKGLNVLGKIEVGRDRSKEPRNDNKIKRGDRKKKNRNVNSAFSQEQKDKLSSVHQDKGERGEKRWKDNRPNNSDKPDFKRKDRKPQGQQQNQQNQQNQQKNSPQEESVYKLKPNEENKAANVDDKPAHFKKRKKNSSFVNIDEEVNKRKESTTLDKGKKKRKKSIRDQIKDEDINKAIKATLAGMEDSGVSARQKAKQKKKIEREIKQQIEKEEIERTSKILQLTEFVTTSDLANLMDVSPSEIIKKCMLLGLMVTINQRLDIDTITLIADDYGFEVEFQDQKVFTALEDEEDPEETLKSRAPIVTIMGHVDHGKTSLLDHIRNTRVVAGESGGITQHIGAYHVELKDDKFITFLDTPGHEAFTAMRARGAQITDIVILVVAADDSVMPQTKEAISHAQAANVPIVVAINKIDKPEANPEKIKQQLSENNVLVEEWGGKYQSVEISAKQGLNIDELLDKILLEADILDLKANPDRNARATVIESNLDKGFGVITTIIVRKGTLKVGDIFVAGTSYGRVRAMFDERGHKIEHAIPSMPVRIVGFDGMPSAGDNFVVVDNESQAKKVANERAQLKREQELKQIKRVSLNEFSNSIAGGEIQTLNVILKADVNGSVEALSDELQKLSHEEVVVNILMKGVGQINESDVQLAVASNAIIITFHTGATAKARQIADKEGIEIRDYEIIYEAIDDVRNALEGMLRPEVSEQISGEAEIRAIFKLGRVQKIAGCKVISGKINRNSKARILRDGLPVYEGKISSLKREKDDAKEVSEGYECGIMVDGFNDYQEDDIIQAFTFIETKRTF